MKEQDLQAITIDMILNKEHAKYVRQAITVFENVQKNLYALAEKGDEETLTGIKAGTIILLSVLKKMTQGKMPNTFDKDDYADIAKAVSEYVVLMDDQDYSAFVFDLYAGYIDASVKVLTLRVEKNRAESIQKLSEELRHKSEQLKNGQIKEAAYIEDCLWISLEAMIKLLSAYIGSVGGKELTNLSQAAATFAFEYGRLMLYKREQALLTEYIDKQYQLDEELSAKFEAYKAELKADSDRFNELVSKAFKPDFASSLRNSVELAIAAGVPQEEVLDSVDKIDSFFLD